MKSQKQVWNNIAEEWNEFKISKYPNIMEFLKKQQGKILDLGSGSGRHLTKIKNGKMYLVDFSEKMIKLAQLKAKKESISAEFFVSEVHNLPFEDNFFDGAICIAALHCIPDKKEREKTIKELYRVLKPKAKAKISVWNKDTKRFKNSEKEKYIDWRDKGKRYYYLYSKEEIYKLFEKNCFKIIFKEEPFLEELRKRGKY
jgi:ubiquinone/menaquinone biosynthesis C-methylase UbiE